MRKKMGLVEDDDRVRRRFAHAIGRSHEFELWFETGSMLSALEWMSQCPPDAWPSLWLVDLGLPDGSGLSVIRHALALHPQTQVMVVSMFGDESKVLDCIDAGAMGYILKGQGDEDILLHIEDLLHGGSPMSPIIARQVLSRFRMAREVQRPGRKPSGSDDALADPYLTARELDVLDWIARGYSYEEVAANLQVALNTIRHHVRGIYAKLGVHTKVDAINEARRRRWLDAS
ncbi:response regulator transcription factor [Aquabacterium sp.]|uniref:response regulator transcription factor n=1 Tax=Aquabacterium sp. TaxID=1872578 RepID=UPI0040377647